MVLYVPSMSLVTAPDSKSDALYFYGIFLFETTIYILKKIVQLYLNRGCSILLHIYLPKKNFVFPPINIFLTLQFAENQYRKIFISMNFIAFTVIKYIFSLQIKKIM